MSDQIKMFIAGEEVVSQNEFTINEEMLSASSTILNNCYPKSWELTKDYISNFYYPKDYSRFVIGQGEYLHGNDEFEPLEITGKNLFQVNDLTNGIVKSYNSGEININGTITGSAYYSQIGTTTLKSGTYYFSFNSSVPLPAGSRVLFIKNGTAEHLVYDNTTVVISENVTYDIGLVLNAGTFLNVVLRPQIEFGNVKTSYEPYNQTNLSYETNVEKEWNSFNIYGNTYQATRSGKNLLPNDGITQTLNGITFTKNDDGTIVANGTATGTTFYKIYAGTIASTGLYFSNIQNAVSDLSSYVSNENDQRYTEYGNGVFIPSGYIIKSVYIRVSSGVSLSNAIFKPMLEVGNQATEYEQYGVMPSPDYPSELVSVGYENLLKLDSEFVVERTTQGITKKISNDGGVIVSGTPIQNNSFWFSTTDRDRLLLKAGTYTMSASPSVSLYIYIRKINSNTKQTISTNTFTVNEDFYVQNMALGLLQGQEYNETFYIQITKGSQAHSYIPYSKYGIEIKNTGKNLLEPNFETSSAGGITITYTKNGWLVNGTPTSTVNAYIFNSTLPAGTYTINGIEGSANNKYQLVVYKAGIIIRYLTTGSYTFILTEETAIALRLYLYQNYGTFNNLLLPYQLEKGTQATTYEEYKSNSQLYVLDEPLRAIGQYQDKLYVDNGVLFVERKIGSVILNGSENWQYLASNYNWFYVSLPNLNANDYRIRINALCNYYKAVLYTDNLNNGECTTYIGGGNKFAIKNTNYTNANDFKNWLSTHNTEVQYILATTTTTPIGYVDLPNSYENINYVELATGLETSMEVYYYWKNYDVLFAGVVKNSGDISLNPRHPHYCSLQILDYKTFLSESNTLDFVIANKTISEAISMVVNAVSGYGFIVGNIDIDSANDIIGAYSTLNKSAYDVLQYLAEISGSRWRARVVDSLTMAIDFYDPDTLPQAEDIEYTKEYWENNNIVDLTFNYGTRDYRNKQILLSDEVYANINYDETLISNGYSNTFTLQNNIGDIVSVVVDGAEKTIGTNNDKQMGVEADFYFTPGKNVVESNSVYSAGTMIHLTYQPLVKGRQIVYNNSEIDRISQQTQTEGVIARYETRNDVLSSDELEKIAKTYIEYKGKAEVILTLRTQNKDLYNIGEVVYFNAPISDLAQNYMVKSKKIEYVVINKIVNLFYIYELTSSFNNEKAINYFDNQRSKATGNIEEGESITRNVDIETQANIIWSDGSVSSASVTVTGDNVLNCALNSPFVE